MLSVFNYIVNLISSKDQTKEWRKKNICSKNGQRHNKCEIYQKKCLEEITKKPCEKTNYTRINHRELKFENIRCPLKKANGFDYSEDFDGYQNINNKKFYYNFKFVCGDGGSQTRTLRDETYRFVETQLKYIKKNKSENIMFINILDGDQSFKRQTHFEYLLNLNDYKDCKTNCFVGDMKDFQVWFSKFNK